MEFLVSRSDLTALADAQEAVVGLSVSNMLSRCAMFSQLLR